MTEENLGEREDASSQVLYEQLQGEYNKLLKQYAAAENTIDVLRTGATVHLYTEPLESRPNSRLSFETARYPQNINFPRPLQASTSEFSTMNETCSTIFTTGGRVETPIQRENTRGNLSLQARIQALKEDVNTVESILSESGLNNEETLNELLVICTQLHKEHNTLTRELKLQSRNTVGLSASSDGNNFSTKTELQKELYRIGLRIEEIQGDIMAGLKTKKPTPAVKSEKPSNDKKASLSPDLESLVKEMRDLKDASIKNSQEILNSSRMANTRTGNVLPRGRYSEAKHDVVDSRYFTASPVNMEYPPNTLSGSDESENEQTLNVTWPPSHNAVDSDILRHSFSETTQGYDQSIPDEIKTRRSGHSPTNHSMSNGQSPQNNDQPRTDHFSADNSKPSYYSRKKQPKQFKSDQQRSDLKRSEGERRDSLNIRKHSPYSEEETVHHRSEQHRSDPSERGDDLNSGNIRKHSQFSSQETVVYKSDSSRPDLQGNKHLADTREHSSYSDQEHEKDKRLSKHSDCERKDYQTTKKHSPYSDEEAVHHKDNQTPKHSEKRSPEHLLGSPDLGARNFNSMSSLADSSRMSTPLFQPRGATRVSPHSTRGSHTPRYKQRNPSDGFDSGFVGSEASRSSRLTTDRPDGVQKLNISNQWDSSLHLDLVSEIDENETTSSPEQMSTTYELTTTDGRQSPTKGTKSRQLNEDVKFINCSPPSSPETAPRTPAGYFEYRSSHTRLLSNGGNSLPVHNTADPLLSHINERPLLEHRPSSERGSSVEETSRIRMDRRKIRRAGSRDVTPEVTADIRGSGNTVRPPRRTNEHNERKLQVLRNELDSLHDHVDTLQRPRVTMDMYDEFRDHDEQLRRGHERKHERKLDELRQSIEQLKQDIKSRNRKDRRRPDRDTEFYDDFRSELRKVTDRLDELTALRNTSETSPTTHVLPSEFLTTHHSPHDEDMAKRFSNLVQKVDELRLRIENPRDNFGAPRETSRHFCRLCYEADVQHRGNGTENAAGHQPRASTPFVSDVHHGPESTAKVEHRSYLSSTYPGAILQQSPVVHHIHTYHKGPGLRQQYETDSDDDVKRTPRRKHGIHRSRYRPRHDLSYNDHLSLDDARKAAWDVQRLSKNILNSITLDLTSLKS